MPEGPEIRRAADRIGKALVGKVVEDGTWPFPSLQQADSLILGHEVLSVTSRAKAMLIRFSSGYTMYSHNQLYGRWTVHLKTTDPNQSLPAGRIHHRQARCAFWSATDIVLQRPRKRPPISRSPWAGRARRIRLKGRSLEPPQIERIWRKKGLR